MRAAGFDIISSNNFALNFGVSTLSGKLGGAAHTRYDVNNTTAVGMAIQKQALGSVHLMNVATEDKYMVERQGTLVVSKMAVGHGVLRPECIRLLDAAI